MSFLRRDTSSTISAELLVSTGLLFGAALLVAVLAAVLVLPSLTSPSSGTLFLALILVADLAILFLFLRHVLRRDVLSPLEGIGEHAERIAAGEYEDPIPPTGRVELDRLVDSVNTMARRLIRDQHLLEENVRSLDRTNRELVDTTDELLRTARMASVGTLAGGIAHELGNPLGALRTSLDLARMRLRSGGDADRVIEVALEEAGRIDQIIRSILEFVRSRGGTTEWSELDPEAGVREAVDLLDRRGTLEGIVAEVRLESSPPGVRAHPQLFEQVLVNLLMNAARSVRRGDRAHADPAIEVVLAAADASGARLPARREGDPPGTDYMHRRRLARLREGAPAGLELDRDVDAVVEVRDRGTGIDEADLERIFDPFFTTNAPGEGTGMGLAITSRIVEELGGTLEAENRKGGGAVFRVRLPGLDRSHEEVRSDPRDPGLDHARTRSRDGRHGPPGATGGGGKRPRRTRAEQ